MYQKERYGYLIADDDSLWSIVSRVDSDANGPAESIQVLFKWLRLCRKEFDSDERIVCLGAELRIEEDADPGGVLESKEGGSESEKCEKRAIYPCGGWGAISIDGVESRDVAASFSRLLGASWERRNLILAADRRLLACVNERTDVYLTECGEDSGFWNCKRFMNTYGFDVRLYGIYLALTGCQKLGISGICSELEAMSLLRFCKTFPVLLYRVLSREIGLRDCPDSLVASLRQCKIWWDRVSVNGDIPLTGLLDRLHEEPL